MKLSFVIPAYNEEKYIEVCLKSLLEETKSRSYVVEVIVVNNASIDKTVELAKSFPGVKVVDEPRRGSAFARQKGLEEACGDLIAYIDADTRIYSGWFDKMEKVMFGGKNIIAFSGPYKYYDATRYQKIVLRLLWNFFAPIAYRLSGYTLLGGNFVAKKEAIISAGGFDTSIKFFGDDMDIAKRLSKLGKIKFDMSFFIYSSCRRFAKYGILRISFLYGLNFIWQVLFSRPYKNEYSS